MLVGCLSVLAVVIVVVIIATIFVIRSYRGWIAGGIEKAADAALVQMQLDDGEQTEVMAHMTMLLDKYKSKEIDNEAFFGVFGKLVESPLVASALVGGIDKLYIADSELNDEEKTDARVQLRRFANGLFEEQIDPSEVEVVLASVSTTTPDDNDIVLQYQTGPAGSTQFALRSADEVSGDDLRELIAQARAKADDAGIESDPPEIDISDTLGIAIAEALGEDPTLWVPNANELLESQSDPVEQTPVDEDPETPGDLDDNDGP
ncbi:MAG: hypothetical protein CMJ25_30510 [Phycisphaerae bacterium]|nr:hypothetical protein [Phycisphaerae bacterium]|tara:strand:- start:528 stop:1313 length:786 start_codon:yes stop_codon:yes gene_type:complete